MWIVIVGQGSAGAVVSRHAFRQDAADAADRLNVGVDENDAANWASIGMAN